MIGSDIYNKSFWGKGACNDIGWGIIYKPFSGCTPAETRFVISVKTDNIGTSNDDQFTLPWIGSYDVEWGDGNTDTAQTDTTTHTYASAGTYDVSVTPTNQCRINFNNGGDKQKLIEIKNWGTGTWTMFTNAFNGCSSMDITATDVPDLSVATALNNMFRNCLIMVGNSSFENWGTSNIGSMSGVFRQAKLFNQNISSWDVSGATTMSNAFFDADSFNQPIGSWDTGNVTSMNNMFRSNLSTFDQSLANWDITSLTNGASMFNTSGLSTANYDATLIGWAAQGITNAVSIDFGSSQYTLGGAAEAARNTLVSTYGWTIVDGGGI
jgi:surface protein